MLSLYFIILYNSLQSKLIDILRQDFRNFDKRLTPEYYQKPKLLKTNKVLYNNFKHQSLHDVGGLFMGSG